MLIEFPQIIIDDKKFAENIKANIQVKSHQMRMKATYTNNDQNVPIDLVIYKWNLKLNKITPVISIDGKEYNFDKPFYLEVSYDLIKRQMKLSGKVDGNNIDTVVTNIKELLEIPKVLGIQY